MCRSLQVGISVVTSDMNVFMIRKAEPSDVEQIIALVRVFPTPTPPSDDHIRSCFAAMLSDPRAYLAVAIESDGLCVGYLSGYRHAAFYASGETAWCDEVLVMEDRRGLGIGTQLVGRFEEWARQSGCVLVSLATAGAKGFYESLGYSTKAGYFKKYLPRT
jgi:GNAT superfamily N-acetyltransferase